MDFLRSDFRHQTGNLDVDTSPGPVLESNRDRIKRISKSSAKSPHSSAPSKLTGADSISSKARISICILRQLVLLLQQKLLFKQSSAEAKISRNLASLMSLSYSLVLEF